MGINPIEAIDVEDIEIRGPRGDPSALGKVPDVH